jgi:thioredoxin 1
MSTGSKSFLMLLAAILLSMTLAFTNPTVCRNSIQQPSSQRQRALHAVADIQSEGSFDKSIQESGDKLVIIDYSTTWCGPCKVIAPKFEEFSNKYPNAIFLKVIGDASPDASKLMKREGVRSVPSFHYFKNGEKVDVVNGANADAIEAAITKYTS